MPDGSTREKNVIHYSFGKYNNLWLFTVLKEENTLKELTAKFHQLEVENKEEKGLDININTKRMC